MAQRLSKNLGKYSLFRDEYSFLSDGSKVYRIISNYDFVTTNGMQVKKGDFGGMISSADNLDTRPPQNGSVAWIDIDSTISHKGRVEDNAFLENSHVYENGTVSGNAIIIDSEISGTAKVCDSVRVVNDAHISGNAEFFNDCEVDGAFVDTGSYDHYDGIPVTEGDIAAKAAFEKDGLEGFEKVQDIIISGEAARREADFIPNVSRRLPSVDISSDSGYSSLDLEEFQ